MLNQLWAALMVCATGVASSAWGFVLAQADGGSDIAPYISGGGSITAVGALVYFAKKVFNGELVPRNVSDQEALHRRAVEALERLEPLLYRSPEERTRRTDRGR